MPLAEGCRKSSARARIGRTLRRFFANRSASVTVDFVISIPILLAVLVLTSEYGRVLQMRATLDNAVADAARYLSRAPLDETGEAFPPSVVSVANQLITSRLNTSYVAISNPVIGAASNEAGGFATVGLSAAAGVASPILGLFSLGGGPRQTADGLALKEIEGLIVTSADTVRYFGR
ncbi:pilus assembly protein [Pikeienuella piscinae]|uniref:Pilus assembly protein n=1 Tax=Pikeienuella piscinae TaxID=2748098 RepID=A0A7M3T5E5_9RHOB|nr:TadE/TadG family type IV pilus assembly protein [Pikeienuella piscinae]QIE57226.1 pilus assembly protein [Pikeienuella piscinae]